MEIKQLRIRELSKGFLDRSLSPVQIAEKIFVEIERRGLGLNCFITILRESALKQAEESERRYERGSQIGPLDGMPIAIKDLFYINGVRCTAGSKILSSNVATYDAPVVAKLKAAGAVLIGTTNMHEFAAGITGENPHFGTTRNPWDLERISGGSSSGSAASVAAGLSAGALGTDTAGSVRTPAALCGIVGLKPTYGLVSRLGVIPLASSFDTVGTLTTCAWDAAAMLKVIAGHETEDLTTVENRPMDYLDDISGTGSGLRVGTPRKPFHENLDQGVAETFSRFLDKMLKIGCTLKEMELQGMEKVDDCWQVIRSSEATAFHLRWLESSPEAYGEDVRASLERGREVKAVDYVNAQNLRPTLMKSFSESMNDVDIIVAPTASIVAPLLGQKTIELDGRRVDVRSSLISLTLPFNTVGFPAVSVPIGLSHGLPVGAQLVAGPFEEAKLLRIANALERVSPYSVPSDNV